MARSEDKVAEALSMLRTSTNENVAQVHARVARAAGATEAEVAESWDAFQHPGERRTRSGA